MAAILECVDKWGRPIELDEDIWLRKIVRGGTRLPEDSIDSIRQALTQPDFITFDKSHEDGECFYRAGVLPGNLQRLHLKVCVKISYELHDAPVLGRVITAFPTDRVPKGERLKWP